MTEDSINTKLLEELKEFVEERKQCDQKNLELFAQARKFPWCKGPPIEGSRVYHLKKGPGVVEHRGSSYVRIKFSASVAEIVTCYEWTDLIDLTVITLFGRQLTLDPDGRYYYCNKEKPFISVHEPGRGPNLTAEWQASVSISSGSIQASGCCLEEVEDILIGKIRAKCVELLTEVDQLRTLSGKYEPNVQT